MVLSSDDSKVIVGFGPIFMVATVDVMTGRVMYSGTSSALSTQYTLPASGIGHSLTNPFIVKTDNVAKLMQISKCSIDYLTE